MPNLPHGFKSKANGGVSLIRRCADCVLAMHEDWLCPAIELMKEAGIRPFRALYRPNEPQNSLTYAETLYETMHARAQRLECRQKRLFVTADREYREMLAKERRG